MEHLDFDVVGGVIALAAFIVYIVRQEGKLNLLTEIVNRIEGRQVELERRYNIDGQYDTIHRRGGRANPAE